MGSSARATLAIQGGAQAGLLTLLLGIAAQATLEWFGAAVLPWTTFGWTIGIAAIAAGVLTAIFIQVAVTRRMKRVVDALDKQALEGALRRLPDLGDDEVGEIARAVNRVLANMTSMEVLMIEQSQELALKEALAEKSLELEKRLEERALLFDILRTSASDRELDEIFSALANRLGEALELREFVLFLSDASAERLIARAAFGFPTPDDVLDRIILFTEGPIGQTAQTSEPFLARDLAEWEEPHLLWGLAPKRGSLAVFPVLHRGEAIGVMAATRDDKDAFSAFELSLLSAISDQLALAIRHAQLFDELRRGSHHDDLTGLGNRRLLRARLEDELLRAQRFGQMTSVLTLDIDFFKSLNDRCGHPTGDASLRKLAGIMTRNLRRIDTVARVGGEEFVVLLPRTDEEEALGVAEKIRTIVEQTEFPGGTGQPEGMLTVSVGVASLRPGEDGESLLARADEALYEAKSKGRNRVERALQRDARSLTRSRI